MKISNLASLALCAGLALGVASTSAAHASAQDRSWTSRGGRIPHGVVVAPRGVVVAPQPVIVAPPRVVVPPRVLRRPVVRPLPPPVVRVVPAPVVHGPRHEGRRGERMHRFTHRDGR